MSIEALFRILVHVAPGHLDTEITTVQAACEYVDGQNDWRSKPCPLCEELRQQRRIDFDVNIDVMRIVAEASLHQKELLRQAMEIIPESALKREIQEVLK